MKVIITTSGTGSRLGEITNYINKSLVNIGDNYAIDLIIKHYKDLENIEFIITIGYYGDLVKQYLNIAYPELKFIFVNIDKYEGEGSSLGYSLLQTKKYIDEPFYFHCCDCLIDKIPEIDLNNNYLFVYDGKDSSSYASVKCNKNLILNVNEKGEKNFDYIYIGLSYMKDYHIFFDILEKIYNKDINNSNISDIHIYMKLENLNYKIIDQWYDTGNIKSYRKIIKNTKTNYDVLIKTNESLSFHQDKVVKFFSDSNRNLKRLKRQKILNDLTPKILNSSQNFHSMELIDSKPLSKIYDRKLIKKLLNWAWANLWEKNKKPDNFFETCYNFYYHKTIKRITLCLKEKKAIDYKNINNIEIGNCFDLIKKIDFDFLCHSDSYKYHGDFILDNILIKDEKFCLIDWREDFGSDLVNGDMYYDLGKLRHSIFFNHENINNNLFSIEEENKTFLVDMKCNYFLIDQISEYDNFIKEKNLDIKKIKIINALIWINMAALHEYPLSNFLFNFGKYNLFNSLDI